MEAVGAKTNPIFSELIQVTEEVRHLINERKLDLQIDQKLLPEAVIANSGLVERVLIRQGSGGLVREIFYEALHRREVDIDGGRFLLGYFSVPYMPSLSLDSMIVEVLPKPCLTVTFPSDAVPVNEILSSKGFASEQSVAIFPENFASHRAGTTQGQPIYYIINKFLKRTKAVTLKFVERCVESSSFHDLLSSKDNELQELLLIWVSLHEHFHNSGKCAYFG